MEYYFNLRAKGEAIYLTPFSLSQTSVSPACLQQVDLQLAGNEAELHMQVLSQSAVAEKFGTEEKTSFRSKLWLHSKEIASVVPLPCNEELSIHCLVFPGAYRHPPFC